MVEEGRAQSSRTAVEAGLADNAGGQFRHAVALHLEFALVGEFRLPDHGFGEPGLKVLRPQAIGVEADVPIDGLGRRVRFDPGRRAAAVHAGSLQVETGRAVHHFKFGSEILEALVAEAKMNFAAAAAAVDLMQRLDRDEPRCSGLRRG